MQKFFFMQIVLMEYILFLILIACVFVRRKVSVMEYPSTKQNYSKFFNGFKMKKYICGMEQSVMI